MLIRPNENSIARRIAAFAILFAIAAAGPARAEQAVKVKLADGFDFPCGPPDGKGYYKARGFWPNGHLGEDWNGGSGDTDLGAPIHTVADGVVIVSEDVRVGWGNCIIVRHAYRDSTGEVKMVDSQYAHLLRRMVNVGDVVKRGQQIGTMGNNRGMYLTHLHFEMRKNLQIGMNRSRFSRGFENYYDPTRFINAHRKLISDWRKYPIPIDNFAAYNAPAPKSTPKEKIEVPTPKDTPSELEDKVRKKLPKEIADILDKAKEERDTPSDEEMEGLWQRFKQIIKLKKKSD